MMAAMAPLYWRLHMEQLDGLLAGVDVALTDDVLDRIDEIRSCRLHCYQASGPAMLFARRSGTW